MRPTDDSPRTSPDPAGGKRPADNAFTPAFLDHLRRHHDHPPVPEALNAGPWTVGRASEASANAGTAGSGAGDGRSPGSGAGYDSWFCRAAGEAEPRAHLVTADLAFLTAAALPLTGVEPRFFLAEDPDIEAPLCDLLDGDQAIGVVDGWNDELADRMSTLDALRRRPLALAHFLLAVGDETLRRVGTILLELSAEAGDPI